MKAIHAELARLSVWLWPALSDHLWQATLFTLVVFVACGLLRRGPARVRFVLWLLASAKFVVPSALFALAARSIGFDVVQLLGADKARALLFFYQFTEPLSFFTGSYRVSTAVGESPGAHAEIYCALTILWLAGFLLLFIVWLVRRRALLLAVRSGRVTRNGREHEALERASARLGHKSLPALLISGHAVEPCVWRIWRPVIVIPERVSKHLDDDEMEAVMLHELVHIERRDNLFGQAQAVLCRLFWFHPLVWVINNRLLDERERACDERVLEIWKEPCAYASSILKVVRVSVGWRVSGVAGAADGPNLRRRIENIMNDNTNRKLKARHGFLVGALACLAVILSTAGFFGFNRHDSAVAQAAASTVSDRSEATVPPASLTEPNGEPSQDSNGKKARGKADKEGRLISAPKPDYPEEAKQKGIAGTVSVRIVVDEEGKVIRTQASEGPVELRAAAEAAASKARFEPTTVKGKPVKVAAEISYDFVLDRKEENK